MEYILNGRNMTNIDDFYDEVEKNIDVPEYYERNLDALYDMLIELTDAKIIIDDSEIMFENLGSYADSINDIFNNAAEENFELEVIMN